MLLKKHRLLCRDEGWTFVEATLAVVVMAIMVLGLTIVLLAFREHLDRSWMIRSMDQYANNVIEQITHEMRNAVDVSIRPDTRVSDRFTITSLDPIRLDTKLPPVLWYADLRKAQILRNHLRIDKYFPPGKLKRGERFEITRFKLIKYGLSGIDPKEKVDASFRSDSYKNATYTLELTLEYYKSPVKPGDYPWKFAKSYSNRIYMRNKNLQLAGS